MSLMPESFIEKDIELIQNKIQQISKGVRELVVTGDCQLLSPPSSSFPRAENNQVSVAWPEHETQGDAGTRRYTQATEPGGRQTTQSFGGPQTTYILQVTQSHWRYSQRIFFVNFVKTFAKGICTRPVLEKSFCYCLDGQIKSASKKMLIPVKGF